MSSSSSTFASGGSPTAAQVNGWSQGTLGYAQVTANQGTFTTPTDLTSLTVTVTLVAGRRVRVSGSCLFSSSVGADGADLIIKEGATTLQDRGINLQVANAAYAVYAEVILAPSAGSHTYKLTGNRFTGTGNITMQAAATFPAYILVEDIGAV